jgi:hypothetical protein
VKVLITFFPKHRSQQSAITDIRQCMRKDDHQTPIVKHYIDLTCDIENFPPLPQAKSTQHLW